MLFFKNFYYESNCSCDSMSIMKVIHYQSQMTNIEHIKNKPTDFWSVTYDMNHDKII